MFWFGVFDVACGLGSDPRVTLQVLEGTTIHNEIARRGLSSLSSWGIWPAPSGVGGLDLALKMPYQDALAGSIWPRMAPLLGRSGLEWLDLDAPGVLTDSIWLLCAILGVPTGSIWPPNKCPIDTISKKKSICLSTILLRCCLLRALWNVSSCLKTSLL